MIEFKMRFVILNSINNELARGVNFGIPVLSENQNIKNFCHLNIIMADVIAWLPVVEQKVQFGGVNFLTMRHFVVLSYCCRQAVLE